MYTDIFFLLWDREGGQKEKGVNNDSNNFVMEFFAIYK